MGDPGHYTATPILLALAVTVTAIFCEFSFSRRLQTPRDVKKNEEDADGRTGDYESLIGNTPLIHLEKLSAKLQNGSNIYVKMESMNPGGTGKDRAALFMLRDAENKGLLPPKLAHDCALERNPRCYNTTRTITSASKIEPNVGSAIEIAVQRSKTGGIVVEGTSGSTGISLATLAAQRGHSSIIVMPDDQAKEKQTILRCLGAVLHVVPTAAISNPNHYVNVARKIAEEVNRLYGNDNSSRHGDKIVDRKDLLKVRNLDRPIKAAFMNQFENEANFNAHVSTTGPEIWEQTGHQIDVFCMSSGTGGTISGVGQYLKTQCQENDDTGRGNDCKIVLVDPPGSALLNKVKYNIAYASEQKERALLRHRYDTLAEGIGLDRVTRNFALGIDNGIIDDAIRITDQEAVDMAHWLLKEEGLFVGSSSSMNVCGALKIALDMKSNSRRSDTCIVTVICDGGQRHLTRFWNKDFILSWGLVWPGDDEKSWIKRLPQCLH
mmetsp:Transcript_4066/g.6001  ORF Transcript_4066/g.6001 Transcript_4066/m.6001 type:complete len:493 (-) Transcript_4066:146-1624(-)|eukprot:CAMPEP_0194118854 /NCGR_PEP_ID=MMETSP0150-20130528/37274_1 /TAXON_ID=122233 /ORGANISM="Chaetoceros debilis, Strain MM31A-1" /LENGTH=492 /DNA_ID=CAMNT_0038810379 /DNA_START=63 /DNA_END=1541 /DNA_ORIENTATION=-